MGSILVYFASFFTVLFSRIGDTCKNPI